MTAINAHFMANHGVDMYGTSFPVYLEAWGSAGQSVMLFYLMALCIKIFGFSMLSVRLPMLVISILSILVFYDLTKKITKNKKLALLAMFFVSICPWHFLQSIWSIDCNMFPHFFLFSVYFLYRGITEKKYFLYISMLFFSFTMYTYGVSVYIIPFFLLISAIYLLKQKWVNLKDIFICLMIYFTFSGPIFAMYIINFFKMNTNIHLGPITIQSFANSTRTEDMLIFSKDIGKTVWTNIVSLVKTFFLQYDGLEWNASKYFGTVYHISILFLVIGLRKCMKKTNQNVGIFFFKVWFFLSLLLGIFINDTNINRLNCIWFPTLFFTCYGIYTIYQHKKKYAYVIVSLYIILFSIFIPYFYISYTNTIGLSGCFSRKATDAIHYANVTLKKNTTFFTTTDDIYRQFEDLLDDTNTKHLDDLEILKQRLQEKQKEEAFIIPTEVMMQIPINLKSYQSKQFENYWVIY